MRTADHLVQTVDASRLMGASVIISCAATGAGGGAELAGERAGVLPGDLVGEQGVALSLGQPGQGLHHGGLLLPRHQTVVVCLVRQQVDDAMLVGRAPATARRRRCAR